MTRETISRTPVVRAKQRFLCFELLRPEELVLLQRHLGQRHLPICSVSTECRSVLPCAVPVTSSPISAWTWSGVISPSSIARQSDRARRLSSEGCVARFHDHEGVADRGRVNLSGPAELEPTS